MPRRRRLAAGQRPLWGSTPVDIEIEQVKPLPGWVLLREVFKGRERAVPGTDVVLHIVKPYIHNTVFGGVVAVHPETSKELGIEVGDEVVIKEYQGGRWSFNGDRGLITPSWAIIAKVEK